MSKKGILPSNKSILKTTQVIFLASCTLIFIFVTFNTARTGFNKPKEEKLDDSNKEKCIVSGCNGEVCQGKDEEPVMTICLYKPEYDCYKKAVCEVQEDGSCGWTETKEYQECLNNISK